MKVDGRVVLELRRQGWELQRIADRYGVTKEAISLYCSRTRTRTNAPSTLATCESCKKEVIVSGDRRKRIRYFCSQKCYHDWYAFAGSWVWRQGQRIARARVQKHFSLGPHNVVHHLDRDNRNNDLSNLWVFATSSEHMSFHRGGEGKPIWKGSDAQALARNPACDFA